MSLKFTLFACLALFTLSRCAAQEVSYGNETTKTTVIEEIPSRETWMIAAMDKDTHVLVNSLADAGEPQMLVLGADASKRAWVNIVSGTCGGNYSFPLGVELPVQLPNDYPILITTPPGKFVWIVKGPRN